MVCSLCPIVLFRHDKHRIQLLVFVLGFAMQVVISHRLPPQREVLYMAKRPHVILQSDWSIARYCGLKVPLSYQLIVSMLFILFYYLIFIVKETDEIGNLQNDR